MTDSILGSMMFIPRRRSSNDDSISEFGDSISRMGASFKNLMESTVTNNKESVKKEIVRLPTAQESFIEAEKTRNLRMILDDQDEFRKFKAEMRASGRVCNSIDVLDEKIANKLKNKVHPYATA
jgi:intergrase/recombinase